MMKWSVIVFVIFIASTATYYYIQSSGVIELTGGISKHIDRALLVAPIDVSEYGVGILKLHDGRGTVVTSSVPGHLVADVTLGKPRASVVKGEDADVYVLMHINGGGTGTFQYLVRYQYTGSTRSVSEVEKVLLGDRITVSDIATDVIAPAQYVVSVSLKDRKPREGMFVEPTQERVLQFSLKIGALSLDAVTFGTLADNDVVLVSPLPSNEVNSLFSIQGAARGVWYFEGSFPIELRKADGTVLASAIAQAQGEWMTSELVPFTTTMVAPNTAHGYHILVLKKDNPSGDPANDKSIEIPIVLK